MPGTSSRTSRRRVAAAAAIAWLAAGCQTAGGLPEVKGGIEVGLRRGSAWTTLTVRPPYVIGSRSNLKLVRGGFAGSIDTLPVSIEIESDGGVRGRGPYGAIAMDISEGPDQMVFEGIWNGSRVHFEMTSASLKGSIAWRQWKDEGTGFTHIEYCQYVLDRVDQGGSRVGTSICERNLPEETLLEVPRPVHGWLTRRELVVVLLVLLSTPSFTAMEH